MKESLSETDIEINDIEEEKTAAMKDFKGPFGTPYDGAKKDLGRFEEEGRICYRKVL